MHALIAQLSDEHSRSEWWFGNPHFSPLNMDTGKPSPPKFDMESSMNVARKEESIENNLRN